MRQLLLASAAAATVLTGVGLAPRALAQGGSYQQTCQNIRGSGGSLTADCQDAQGRFRTSI